MSRLQRENIIVHPLEGNTTGLDGREEFGIN